MGYYLVKPVLTTDAGVIRYPALASHSTHTQDTTNEMRFMESEELNIIADYCYSTALDENVSRVLFVRNWN